MKLYKIFLSLMLLLSLSIAKDEVKKPLTFDLTDINGTTYHIESTDNGLNIKELKGKVVFLALFGHRCPPCRAEMPGFINFTNNKDYAEKAKILAIEVQGLQRDQLKSFVEEKGLNYSVVPGSEVDNFINLIAYRTNWAGSIPFMVVIDKDGKVANFGVGMIPESSLYNIVDELIPKNNENNTTKQGGKSE